MHFLSLVPTTPENILQDPGGTGVEAVTFSPDRRDLHVGHGLARLLTHPGGPDQGLAPDLPKITVPMLLEFGHFVIAMPYGKPVKPTGVPAVLVAVLIGVTLEV